MLALEKQLRKNSNFAEDEGKTCCFHFVTKLRIASECQVDQAGKEGMFYGSDFAVKGNICLFEDTF